MHSYYGPSLFSFFCCGDDRTCSCSAVVWHGTVRVQVWWRHGWVWMQARVRAWRRAMGWTMRCCMRTLLAMGGSVGSAWGVGPRCARICAGPTGCWLGRASQLRSSVVSVGVGARVVRSAVSPPRVSQVGGSSRQGRRLQIRPSDHALRIWPRGCWRWCRGVVGTRAGGRHAGRSVWEMTHPAAPCTGESPSIPVIGAHRRCSGHRHAVSGGADACWAWSIFHFCEVLARVLNIARSACTHGFVLASIFTLLLVFFFLLA
jgi:hypothetical protein